MDYVKLPAKNGISEKFNSQKLYFDHHQIAGAYCHRSSRESNFTETAAFSAGRDKSPVRLPGAIENSLGQSEVQSALPEWAIKI